MKNNASRSLRSERHRVQRGDRNRNPYSNLRDASRLLAGGTPGGEEFACVKQAEIRRSLQAENSW